MIRRRPKYRRATVGQWVLLGKLLARPGETCVVCGRGLSGTQLYYARTSPVPDEVAVCQRCVRTFEKKYFNPRKNPLHSKSNMKLVLETMSIQTAYREKYDWRSMGFRTRITEVRKVSKGKLQRVYRVWIGKKVRGRRQP